MDGQQPPTGRLESLDALRGFDMFWIIGGDALVKALAQYSGGPAAGVIEQQLEHVPWEGFRFYDLIFPLFLFLVGVVIPFSRDRLWRPGESCTAAYWRIARRTALFFALGLLCNGVLQLDFAGLRVAGVLQRIALCYGCAALVVLHTGVRGQFLVTCILLLGYAALLAFVAAPGSSPGDYSVEGNLPGYIDRHYLPGKIMPEYYDFGDNEGLLSTIPAVATTLIGALAGHGLRSRRSPTVRLVGLAGAGVLCLILGTVWGVRSPVIKILWTSSYVLVAAGWSLLLLTLFHGVIDVLGWRRWAFFFMVIGANAITIYVVQEIFDFEKVANFFLGGAAQHAGLFKPVVVATGVLAAKWLLLLYLYRNRIFLRA